MCEAAAGAHPGKKREVEDSSKKLGALFWKMNKGGLNKEGYSHFGLLGGRRQEAGGAALEDEQGWVCCDSVVGFVGSRLPSYDGGRSWGALFLGDDQGRVATGLQLFGL